MTRRTSATKLRAQLFELLSEVQKGASVLIERDGKVVARLIPADDTDWRSSISEKPRYLVPRSKAFLPMDDLLDEL